MKKLLLASIASLFIFSATTPTEGRLSPEMNGLINAFEDVSNQHWAVAWINELYHEGITAGCGQNPLRYCPEENVTRAQMAIFILRTIHGSMYEPPVSTIIFLDVPSSYWAAAWINELYHEGITGGCGVNPLVFCPDQPVTRAQMAVFLLRAKHGSTYLPPASVNIFVDVDSTYWAINWINQLYTEGLTGGCAQNPLSFCPDNNVTRAEMSVFLLRAKYGPSYEPIYIPEGTIYYQWGSNYDWGNTTSPYLVWGAQLRDEMNGNCWGFICGGKDFTEYDSDVWQFLGKGEYGKSVFTFDKPLDTFVIVWNSRMGFDALSGTTIDGETVTYGYLVNGQITASYMDGSNFPMETIIAAENSNMPVAEPCGIIDPNPDGDNNYNLTGNYGGWSGGAIVWNFLDQPWGNYVFSTRKGYSLIALTIVSQSLSNITSDQICP